MLRIYQVNDDSKIEFPSCDKSTARCGKHTIKFML